VSTVWPDGDAEIEKSGEDVVPITSVRESVFVRLPLVAVSISWYGPCCACLLVEIVRTELPEPLAIETGLKLELVQRGKPLRLRLTLPVKPPDGATVMVSVLLEFTATVMVPEEALSEKSPDDTVLTTSVTVVVWLTLPLVALIVTG
jgi:hypothetical protein